MSRQPLLLQGRKMDRAISPCTPHRHIVSVHLATDVECVIITEDDSFYEILFLHFQLHLLTKVTHFHFVCWCKGLHQSHLVRFKTKPLIFGMSNSLLALATDLQGTSLKSLSHLFNVVIRNMRSTRTLVFTQASRFHKLSVPPSNVIPVWHVFSKPCMKLTLHCNHRSRHL